MPDPLRGNRYNSPRHVPKLATIPTLIQAANYCAEEALTLNTAQAMLDDWCKLHHVPCGPEARKTMRDAWDAYHEGLSAPMPQTPWRDPYNRAASDPPRS